MTDIFCVRTHIIVNSTPDQQQIFRKSKNLRWRTAAILKNQKCSTNDIINSLLKPGNKTANINVKNCSLYTLLTATATFYCLRKLVSWSLTSVFSTNMAISKTKGQRWRAILTQWRKASDVLTSTLAAWVRKSGKIMTRCNSVENQFSGYCSHIGTFVTFRMFLT